jgi:hypothetical protein
MIDPIRKFLRNYKKAKTEIKRVRLEKLLSVPYMWLFLNFEERNIYNHSPFRFIQLDQHESSWSLSFMHVRVNGQLANISSTRLFDDSARQQQHKEWNQTRHIPIQRCCYIVELVRMANIKRWWYEISVTLCDTRHEYDSQRKNQINI